MLLFVSSVTAQESNLNPPPTSNRFGIVEGFWFPEVTCELGAGWERIIFDWAQHQPTANDDWHTLNVDDRWLKSADTCNREVVALLKHTPGWATDGTAGIGVPRGLYLPIDNPQNLWAGFVRKAVDYYASRGVYRFIIWNEPDITADTYGYEFEGTIDDYFQMLKVAYLVAKNTNPAAKIHLAGTTYWHDVNEGRRPYIERLLERIQQDPEAGQYHHYFDVVSLHIYFRTDTVYELVQTMRDTLDGFGLFDHEIWVNETNAAPTDDPNWRVERPVYQIDLEQQAAFVMQAAVLALAGGAERVAVYKLYDQNLPSGGESFGIVSPVDAAPRPAFTTWQTVAQQFADVDDATLAQSEQVDVIHLLHNSGRQSMVAWSRIGRDVEIEIEAVGEKAYMSDQVGNISIVRPVEGVYHLRLLAAKCNDVDGCAVGGNVTLLILPEGDISVYENTAQGRQLLMFE